MLRYLLISDGSSDCCLLHVIDWLLRDLVPTLEVSAIWADPAEYAPSSLSLVERIPRALSFYDCDLLFIHRDAEKEPPNVRVAEAVAALAQSATRKPAVIVVPVRMTEAWLLTDENAIRRAADNPNGKVALKLPFIQALESLPDPKESLFGLLRYACELPPHRKRRFDVRQRIHRVAELTPSFAALRSLPAFRRFESMTLSTLSEMGHVVRE